MLTLTHDQDTTFDRHSGAALDVRGVSQELGGQRTLHRVSFTVEPGEVVAIAGGSGSGKTSLLEALVGLRPISEGRVFVHGRPADDTLRRSGTGFVPQDDIIHPDLPLRQTLLHTAALRLPAGTPQAELESVVDHTLSRLDLTSRADLAVRSLSGGQRKRASIGAELLIEPSMFLLDEPTSGLDPATSADVMDQLHRLAATGTAVVLTTHSPTDLLRCDRVVFLAREGHVAFIGTAAEACAYFAVADLTGVYEALAASDDPAGMARHFDLHRTRAALAAPSPLQAPRATAPALQPKTPTRWARQWRAVTKRSLALLTHNRLTLAILIGSPAMVVGMMALLFRPGTFAANAPSAMPAIQTLFWIAFASFFFGLTYGLLQVVGEFEIFRRERLSGLRVSAYVAAKLSVLAPLLVGVNIAMLGILRGLDRLPALPARQWGELLLTLVLISLAAVAMGLLASSAVRDAAQATLALPMMCFPQVLFAGAVVPLAEMAGAGRAMSYVLADRWGFEALGRTLGLDATAAGDATTSSYVEAFSGTPATAWLVLSAITAFAVVATTAVLERRSRPLSG